MIWYFGVAAAILFILVIIWIVNDYRDRQDYIRYQDDDHYIEVLKRVQPKK
jgi:hypothetical protein